MGILSRKAPKCLKSAIRWIKCKKKKSCPRQLKKLHEIGDT